MLLPMSQWVGVRNEKRKEGTGVELLYTLLMRFVIEQFHVFVLDERAGLGQKLAPTTSVSYNNLL